jgi:hypothetical protein
MSYIIDRTSINTARSGPSSDTKIISNGNSVYETDQQLAVFLVS